MAQPASAGPHKNHSPPPLLDSPFLPSDPPCPPRMFSCSSHINRRTTESSPGSFVHDFAQLHFTSSSCSCLSCSPITARPPVPSPSSWGSSSSDAHSYFGQLPSLAQSPVLNAVGWPVVYDAACAPDERRAKQQEEPQLLATALTTNQLAAFSTIAGNAAKLADIVEAPVEEEQESEDLPHFIVPFTPPVSTIPPTVQLFQPQPAHNQMRPPVDLRELQAALYLPVADAAAAAAPNWVQQLVDPFEEDDEEDEEEEEKRPLSRWQIKCLQSDSYLERSPESDEESELADIKEDTDDDELPTDESAALRAGAEYVRSSYAAGWRRLASATEAKFESATSSSDGYGKRSAMPEFVAARRPDAGQHEAFRRFQERNRPRMNAEAIDNYLSTTMKKGPKPGGGKRQ